MSDIEKATTEELNELVEAMIEAKWRSLTGNGGSWKEWAASRPDGDITVFWAQYAALQAIEETGKWRVVRVEPYGSLEEYARMFDKLKGLAGLKDNGT